MAFVFGADASIAAFLVAFRFAALLRRIFGEGALLNGFVPHFETHRSQDPIQAAKFFRDTFFSSLLVLIGLVILLEIIFYNLSHASEVIYLMMFILPGVLFICLFGINSGLLQCERHFFITGSAPMIYNVIWIGSVWILGGFPTQTAAVGLSCAIATAFFFQWLITVPKTILFLRSHLSWKDLFHFQIFPMEVRKMLSSLSFGVIGVMATQINTAVDSVFARYASLEGPAYLNFAIHLQQLPLALFGVGVAAVLLPSLSRTGEAEARSKLVEFTISRALWFLIPCSAAIFVGGCATLNLLFGRGHFESTPLFFTTQCLWGYGAGLVPMALVLLISPVFYARKDFKTPMICSLVAIGCNLGLNAIFVFLFQWGPASIALATSFASAVNLALLCKQMKRTEIRFSSALSQSIVATILCTLFAGALTAWVGHTFFQDPTLLILGSLPMVWESRFMGQLLHFLTLGGTFLASFCLAMVCLYGKGIRRFFLSQ